MLVSLDNAGLSLILCFFSCLLPSRAWLSPPPLPPPTPPLPPPLPLLSLLLLLLLLTLWVLCPESADSSSSLTSASSSPSMERGSFLPCWRHTHTPRHDIKARHRVHHRHRKHVTRSTHVTGGGGGGCIIACHKYTAYTTTSAHVRKGQYCTAWLPRANVKVSQRGSLYHVTYYVTHHVTTTHDRREYSPHQNTRQNTAYYGHRTQP